MFISRWQLYLTPNLVNPYNLHKLLWQAFPNMPTERRPFLFRLDGQPRSRFREVLMLSRTEPVNTEAENLELTACKAFRPEFQQGQKLGFKIRANPVKRLKEERKRVPYIREEEQINWLKRQLQTAAEIDSKNILIEGRQDIYFKKDGKAGKIATVGYTGMLEIIEPTTLNELLQKGIGPAKAFGCGLLLVRRI